MFETGGRSVCSYIFVSSYFLSSYLHIQTYTNSLNWIGLGKNNLNIKGT